MPKQNTFNQGRVPVVLKDPTKTIVEHGIHGQREEAQSAPSSRRLITVPLERIRAGRYQKRETVNGQEYQQLKEQIAELGLQFTAILAPDPDDQAYYNLMMGGHLRLQAAAELGITEVQAVIATYDRLKLAKGTYFENKGRQPLTIIEEGLLFQQLHEDEGWSQEQITSELKVSSRSYVSLCIQAVTAAPDIQEMLRVNPGRGKRAFLYLKQLDELGSEKAISLRAPIIQDFLSETISTDTVEQLVKQILKREKGETREEVSVEKAAGKAKSVAVFKGFERYVKSLGDRAPSPAEREDLLRTKETIEALLARSS